MEQTEETSQKIYDLLSIHRAVDLIEQKQMVDKLFVGMESFAYGNEAVVFLWRVAKLKEGRASRRLRLTVNVETVHYADGRFDVVDAYLLTTTVRHDSPLDSLRKPLRDLSVKCGEPLKRIVFDGEHETQIKHADVDGLWSFESVAFPGCFLFFDNLRMKRLLTTTVARGLLSTETKFHDFLAEGVYDPRLLICVASFAYSQ